MRGNLWTVPTMGERCFVRLVNGDEVSPWLYWHWGGDDYAPRAAAVAYVKSLGPWDGPWVKDGLPGRMSTPESRREPTCLVLDFLRRLGDFQPSRLYADRSVHACAQDWGAWDVDVKTGEARPHPCPKDGAKWCSAQTEPGVPDGR